MLTKSQIKLIRSLEHKKYRDEYSLFVAEGTKVVMEFLKNKWDPHFIVCTENWANSHLFHRKTLLADIETIKKISFLKTPSEVIAVFHKKNEPLNTNFESSLGLALDEIQDAGNVGTIIRIALWFNLDYVVLSKGCADIYSPKVVQSSMGALSKMKCFSLNLDDFLLKYHKSVPVYGTYLEGASLYKTKLTSNGIILLGNEGKGISPNLEKYVKYKLYIPSFPINAKQIDSINVAIAAGIICYEFRRFLI